MFDWLADEIGSVNTRKFYLVDGPAPASRRKQDRLLPPSFRKFIARFGNARLYREGSHYRVGVLAAPETVISGAGETLISFGFNGSNSACFKADLLIPGKESPVFERGRQGRAWKTADSFEAWIRRKCATARRTYGKKAWRAIEAGPPPFSEKEQLIVDARRRFRWRVIGTSESGNIRFEVQNASEMEIPFLSIGIRGKRRDSNGELHGGIWLPVQGVLPGQTAVVEFDCYNEWVDPVDVKAFKLPSPGPEDRDRYWEFKEF